MSTDRWMYQAVGGLIPGLAAQVSGYLQAAVMRKGLSGKGKRYKQQAKQAIKRVAVRLIHMVK